MRIPGPDAIYRKARLTAKRVKTKLAVLVGRADGRSRTEHPTSVGEWLLRKQLQVGSGIVRDWLPALGPGHSDAVIAVVVHISNANVIPDLKRALSHLPVPYDLFVTTVESLTVGDFAGLRGVSSIRILSVPEQGRDILPLVSIVNAGLIDSHSIVLKLADDVGGGTIIGSADQAKAALAEFAIDPSLGTLIPAGMMTVDNGWGLSATTASSLLQRIQLELPERVPAYSSGGSYWIRAFVLQGMRSLQLSEWDFEDGAGRQEGSTAYTIERIIGVLGREAGYDVRDTSTLSRRDLARWVAYEPSSVPYRRAFVVAGYSTEMQTSLRSDRGSFGGHARYWDAVVRARPLFPNHVQPILPEGLGFYDPSTPGVLAEQGRLASSVGVGAFMIESAWNRELGRQAPATTVEAIPGTFCFSWSFDSTKGVLDTDGSYQRSTDSEEYAEAIAAARDFIDEARPQILHPRYLKANGNPVLAIRIGADLRVAAEIVSEWRRRARELDIGEILILALIGSYPAGDSDTVRSVLGVDALVESPASSSFVKAVDRAGLKVISTFEGILRSYGAMAVEAERAALGRSEAKSFPLVRVNHDTTATHGRVAEVTYGANPYTFRRWLDTAVSSLAARDPGERFVFVDRWNGWIESATLEPSDHFGSTYLLAIRDVVFRR